MNTLIQSAFLSNDELTNQSHHCNNIFWGILFQPEILIKKNLTEKKILIESNTIDLMNNYLHDKRTFKMKSIQKMKIFIFVLPSFNLLINVS